MKNWEKRGTSFTSFVHSILKSGIINFIDNRLEGKSNIIFNLQPQHLSA